VDQEKMMSVGDFSWLGLALQVPYSVLTRPGDRRGIPARKKHMPIGAYIFAGITVITETDRPTNGQTTLFCL